MIRALITVTALALGATSSAWAYRVLEQIEDAYELSLGAVRLPADERATVVFTACESCRTTALRVTEATRYFANSAELPLADLREIADDLRATSEGRSSSLVYIYFDIASMRVNRIKLSYRERAL